jgi:hypothetical protein
MTKKEAINLNSKNQKGGKKMVKEAVAKEELKPLKFPSVFQKADEDDENAIFVKSLGRYYKGLDNVDAIRPKEEVLNLEGLVKYYPILVKILTKKGLITSDQISVSLPADTYMKERKKESGLIQRIQSGITEENENIKDVKVLPQGVVGTLTALKNKEIQKGLILTIDGGFNTVNVSIINTNNLEILYTRTYYNELGIRNLLEIFYSRLQRKFPEVPYNLQLLKKIFLTEQYIHGKKDVKTEKERSIEEFIDTLITRITGDISKIMVDYDQILVIGGLSYYLKNQQLNTPAEIVVPENNGEFYNVMGMKIQTGRPSIDFGFGDVKLIP